MSDKIDLIYDLLKQDRQEAAEFRKEVRESHRETGEQLVKIETLQDIHNDQLKEHMRRTEIAEKRIDDIGDKLKECDELHNTVEGRLKTLEEPKIVKKYIKKFILGAGAIAGSLVAIAKFFEVF